MLSSEELVSLLEIPVVNTFSGERFVIIFHIASPIHIETDQEELKKMPVKTVEWKKSCGCRWSGLVSFLGA